MNNNWVAYCFYSHYISALHVALLWPGWLHHPHCDWWLCLLWTENSQLTRYMYCVAAQIGCLFHKHYARWVSWKSELVKFFNALQLLKKDPRYAAGYQYLAIHLGIPLAVMCWPQHSPPTITSCPVSWQRNTRISFSLGRSSELRVANWEERKSYLSYNNPPHQILQ